MKICIIHIYIYTLNILHVIIEEIITEFLQALRTLNTLWYDNEKTITR